MTGRYLLIDMSKVDNLDRESESFIEIPKEAILRFDETMGVFINIYRTGQLFSKDHKDYMWNEFKKEL